MYTKNLYKSERLKKIKGLNIDISNDPINMEKNKYTNMRHKNERESKHDTIWQSKPELFRFIDKILKTYINKKLTLLDCCPANCIDNNYKEMNNIIEYSKPFFNFFVHNTRIQNIDAETIKLFETHSGIKGIINGLYCNPPFRPNLWADILNHVLKLSKYGQQNKIVILVMSRFVCLFTFITNV